jgi:hypothetical protein
MASTPALAISSRASHEVNVLLAGLYGRCPCLSAVSPTQPGERTDVWRTGRAAKIGIRVKAAGQTAYGRSRPSGL